MEEPQHLDLEEVQMNNVFLPQRLHVTQKALDINVKQ